jgi:hypothetical protein
MAIPTAEQLREIGRLREGSLEAVPFSVLLHALALRGRTAVLALERHQMRKTIVLDDGVPVDCRSNLVHETLGRFMVATGKLSAEDDNACLKEAMQRGVPEGQILMEKGLVGGVELFRILQQHLAKKLLDLFTWREGRFQLGFEVPDVDSTLKVRVPQLVVMGITKYAAQEEVNAAVAPLVGKTLGLHPKPPFSLEEIKLSAKHAAVLEPLRRRCRMDELAMSTQLDPDEMTRLLYALAVLGVVAPADEIPDMPAPPAAAAPKPAPAAAAPAPVPTPGEPAVDPAAHARLSNEVMQAYLSYRRKDAFDMLELAEDAAARAVEERYLELAQRFNPSRFVGKELAPIAEKARDVFLALARSYGELADPELRGILTGRRRTLREEAKARPAPDFTIKTDLLDPDVQYKKGVALKGAGNFRDALTQLQFACDCDPGNGNYRAELAHCRFKLHSSFAHKALAELDEALRIDPGAGLAALYAGEIHQSLGDVGQAEAYYKRAIKPMSPDRRPIEALKNLPKKRG